MIRRVVLDVCSGNDDVIVLTCWHAPTGCCQNVVRVQIVSIRVQTNSVGIIVILERSSQFNQSDVVIFTFGCVLRM